MDRVISLLAALVGLIALGGAILVHTNGDIERQQMATQIAQLKASVAILGQPQDRSTVPAVPAPGARPAEDKGVADALLALQDRIAALEQQTRDQAAALEAAKAQLAGQAAAPATATVATAEPAASAQPSVAPAAVVADGPTSDCIPLGTRFMAAAGDSMPICKTRVVVKVAAVSDGLASINGAGEVAEGGVGKIDAGCSVAVFSADTASGYAEMRVTCQ